MPLWARRVAEMSSVGTANFCKISSVLLHRAEFADLAHELRRRPAFDQGFMKTPADNAPSSQPKSTPGPARSQDNDS